MPSVFPTLALLRDSLAAVPGVATCRIGLEANMTPADYPMVRIVPSRIDDGGVIGQRGTQVLIYFGQPIHEFTTDLEGQWAALLAMESSLLDKLRRTSALFFAYRDTFLDEDRVDAYKLLAIRGVIEG